MQKIESLPVDLIRTDTLHVARPDTGGEYVLRAHNMWDRFGGEPMRALGPRQGHLFFEHRNPVQGPRAAEPFLGASL